MKAFWEIFHLELRRSVRSRAVALLTGASLLWMLILPYFLKGDGTDAGAFELHVRYSFGVVFVLVLISLASSAASSIARDRADRRLQLMLVRPIRHSLVALGRTLALTAIGAGVLSLAAAILFFQVGRGRTCDHELMPLLEDPAVAVDRLFQSYLRDYPDFKEKVAEQGERAVRRYLFDYVKDAYETVAAGETASWMFEAEGVDPERPMAVRIRVTDMFGRLQQVSGGFRLGERTGELKNANKTLLRIPLSNGTPARELSFSNTGSLSVTIHPRQDISLLVRADSFGWNLARAVLELTSVLALILAIALFFSACLGRSVAIFAVISMLVVMVVSPAAIEQYPDPTTATRADRVSLALTEFSAMMTSPLNSYSPLQALESEICIEWKEVGGAIFANVLLLPMFFSLLAGFVLVRKQDVV